MDDDCKDYRKNKPQQKLYKPGSGPLRRSRYGIDARMDSYELDNGSRGREHSHFGSQLSVNGEDVNASGKDTTNSRHRKPEQQLYVPRSEYSSYDIDKEPKSSFKSDSSGQYSNRRMTSKHDNGSTTGYQSRNVPGRDFHQKESSSNDHHPSNNRHQRQGSEARSISPTHQNLERNRDSRSMETWAGRNKSGSGAKPPSGRRNSAGFPSDSRSKHIVNIDNLPPRFRKKYNLEQSGHQSFDSVDQLNKDRYVHNDMTQSAHSPGQIHSPNNANWSQTLPSRGRGRLRDYENFDREKFVSTYLKSYELQNSRRSTPSSSYMNLYEPNIIDNKSACEKPDSLVSDYENQKNLYDSASRNGISKSSAIKYEIENSIESNENENDADVISHISANLSDMTNLDWNEEVEKNIKFDEVCDTSTSFSQSLKSSQTQEVKPNESRESKTTARSRRRDRRSSSRGLRNLEKKERNRKDSNVSVQNDAEHNRKDSIASVHHDTAAYGLKQRERERRDSHRSNRSSTIGNSRDDLDRWRSLRSYSREQSSERRIVSQCNSRDTSTSRVGCSKDSDGFKMPTSVSKAATWSSAAQKKGDPRWNGGRTSSIERRQSPTPSVVSGEAGEGAAGGAGGARRSRKRAGRRRRNAENVQPAPQPAGATPAPTNVNWRDEILESKKHHHGDRQPDATNHRNRLNSVLSEKSVTESSQPGLLILPQSSISNLHKDQGRSCNAETQKILYDHQNPSKPIIVQTSPTKQDMRMERGTKETSSRVTAGSGYEGSEASRGARHVALLQKVDRADAILKMHTLRGPITLAANWPDVIETRKFLQSALQRLLMSDLKYCQADNIEHQFWKILYYNFIESLRKSISHVTPEEKPEVVKLLNVIIDEGNAFFESLVQMLEKTYKFNTEDYINDSHVLPPKGLGYVGLALISVQKLYVFLGDLARYKEQVNETNNYAKSKFWYTKAQQINPKNGRPYNQLAILAIYARRKLDAVYYYMRSLMSSNPFQSARESLLSLFDENRKKYETAERKRRAAAESSKSESGEGAGRAGGAAGAGLRREVWVRPSGHRTTTLQPAPDDTLQAMTPVELNKNFITSYLHVHGKLITKIGMESFHESAAQMLRQFRALLHRQPLPTPAARLLQLTALNMFAVETTAAALRGSSGGERTAWLDCALGVSLLMFGALLERCCALLPEPAHTQQHADALLLLPAIKVWSDWMLCHSSIWNPPPAFDNFEIDDNDPWDWLAKLMNILEALDDKSIDFESEMKEGYVSVRLPEDASLAGFTPLMYMEAAAAWLPAEPPLAPHAAEHALRTRRLLFFGTEYLVGVEPPVLKLEYPTGAQPRYVSAVLRTEPKYPPLQQLSENSEDDDSTSGVTSGPTSLSEELHEGADEATRKLLRRKEQLESRKATFEKRRQRMQEMLSSGWVSAEVEVRPRWLVPDTNCFIDHLPLLRAVLAAPDQPYQLAVPLVVVSELEGLRRCARLGGAARDALAWVSSGGGGGGGGVRLCTARGSLLAARGVAYSAEEDEARATNDDRVLATALSLHNNLAADTESRGTEATEVAQAAGACVREVVLLTDDRNLRVKALAAELPARDLPSFMTWAGIHAERLPDAKATSSTHSPDV
ncbi:telomerase-binding protein EST1A isoform X3 [Bicyclus anynana]|uniref:Telomerase-binding protein EST1A isoform X3 n=1 Tax=Bicyclus anynana TaxID=110368 RepID=A0ABM3LEE3_BICAN|nr:telomerase-binding protein EST1A isoform X3 [Bicyclus anynana]